MSVLLLRFPTLLLRFSIWRPAFSFLLVFSFCTLFGVGNVFVSDVRAAEEKGTSADAKAYKYNEAENLIFGQSHMDNVGFGQTVKYQFERKGVFGDDFKDVIELIVSKGEGKKNKSVAFNFFTGQKNRPYPAFGFVSANPLLTLYFNKDAWDLSRKIKAKGTANYLRNRIIDGIGQVKNIEKSVCRFQGKDYPAQVISFEPYKGDKNSHHLVHYALIKYELTLSKDIPGGLCKIRSVVPQHVGGVPQHFRDKIKRAGMSLLTKEADIATSLKDVKKPLLVEVLTFDSVRQTGVAQSD